MQINLRRETAIRIYLLLHFIYRRDANIFFIEGGTAINASSILKQNIFLVTFRNAFLRREHSEFKMHA